MKLMTHAKALKIKGPVAYRARPFKIYLSRTVELTLEAGDPLDRVVAEVHKHWPMLKRREVQQVVAYWFALGERMDTGGTAVGRPWRPAELRVNSSRRYLARPKGIRKPTR